ncbi:MAG: hypothetical protein JWN35_2979 [Frankiales bacterium]|nr:hypothetical protein [Frankiales bacterium]
MKTAITTLALLGLLGTAACGSSGSATATAPGAAATPGAQAQGQGGPPRAPGVSGLVAAIEGSTLQVQDTSAQTAVVYTAATAITATVPGTVSDVTVGVCATVRGAASGGASPATSLTATSVTLSRPVNGSCTAGFGGTGGPGRPGGTPPSGASPGAGARGRAAGGGGAGKVTAVNGGTFTLASIGFGAQGSTGGSSTTPLVVGTTPTTTFSTQQRATSASLKTGECVTARGAADSSGTVTATSIAVRPAVNGACTTGFAARNG